MDVDHVDAGVDGRDMTGETRIVDHRGAVVGYRLGARHRDRVRALVFVEALMPGSGSGERSFLTADNLRAGLPWQLVHPTAGPFSWGVGGRTAT